MCLYIDDYGEFTHLDTGHRKARKEHKCEECHRLIQPGEMYFFDTMVDHNNQSVVTTKMCAHCEAVIDIGVAMTGCGRSWWYGSVLNHVDESLGFVANIIREHTLKPGYTVRMLRFVAMAKGSWRDALGNLVPVPDVGLFR